MKLLCLVGFVLVAVSANVLPLKRQHLPAIDQHGIVIWLDELANTVPQKCDYNCTDRDLEVCAHNGQCLQIFTSRCTMQSYNCRNPGKPFHIVENSRCTVGQVPLCSQEERKELKLSP